MSAEPAVQQQRDIAAESIAAAYQYADDVRNGRINVCEFVRLAAARFYRDLDTAHERGLYLDENAAARFFRFAYRYCRHSKGEWAGQRVTFAPWQCFILLNIYGWYWREDDTRRFRTVYEEIPRKNGKTTKLGVVGLYGLVADGESGAEVYSAATKRDQAAILFEASKNMVLQSPPLKHHVDVLLHNLSHPGSFSKYMPLSSDAKLLDGLNPSTGLVDEFHAHRNAEVWNVLRSGMGARMQPLLWAITTAGEDSNSICYQRRDYAIKVLRGILEDDTFFAIIYTLDKDEETGEEDDWRDPGNWKKANPNYGISVSPKDLENQFREAVGVPSEENNFKTKRLDLWVSAIDTWMPMEAWARCEASYTVDDLLGLPAKGGMDLASVEDITSLMFVVEMPDGKKRLIGRHYVAEDTVAERVRKNNVPYDKWVREGWLIATPGPVTDYRFMMRDVYEFMEKLDVGDLAYDRWNSSQLVVDLGNEDVPLVKFGQGYGSMSPAMKELLRLVLGGEIEHNGDPVLTWAMSNLVAQKNPPGDIKPAKDKSTEKIDPAVASIMAIGLTIEEEDEIVYDGELLTL